MHVAGSTSHIHRYRAAAALLILGVAVVRLLYLASDCPLDLAPDEAHYWDWSRHLDWSYYSKGPLVAWIIRLSSWLFGPLSVQLTGTEMLAVRLPAVFFGSLLLVSLYVLAVQVWKRESAALAVVAVALTMPLISAGSSIMTIDSPYTCLWGWALVVGHRAAFRGSWWAWPLAGLLVGVGILAKYTMVLWVPFFGLFLLGTPGFRGQLRHLRFWLLAVVGAFCCVPIVLWNAQHDWVTLRHTASHAGAQSEHLIHWLGPLRYLGTQFGILLGFWFAVWVLAVWALRPGRELRPEVLYLWWMSVPVFAFFGLFSFKNGGGEPNWPVTAYLSGMVLAAGWMTEQFETGGLLWRRWLAGATVGFAVLGLMLSILVHRIVWIQPLLVRIAGPSTIQSPLPLRKIDPTARLRGWRTLGREVDALRAELRGQGIEAELAGASWTLPGELGFYCKGHPAVYSIGSALGERHSQYDLWRPNPFDDPEAFSGKTFIIVGAPEAVLQPAFQSVETRPDVVHSEQAEPINRWRIVIGHGYRGFPRRDEANTF